jgi:hypothetical protein
VRHRVQPPTIPQKVHVLHLMYLGFQCARWAHPDVLAVLGIVARAFDVVERRRTFEIPLFEIEPVESAIAGLVMDAYAPHPECELSEGCQRGHTLHPGHEPLFEYAKAAVADFRRLAESGEVEALTLLGDGLHNLPRSMHLTSWANRYYGVDLGVLEHFDKLSPELKWWTARLAGEDILTLEHRAVGRWQQWYGSND